MSHIESQMNPAHDKNALQDQPEVVYFEGSPVVRGDLNKTFLSILLGLVLMSLPILAWIFGWTWWNWYWTIGTTLGGLCFIVFPILAIRAVKYRITNYRIDYERGLIARHVDTLELWHVDDISFRQGPLDRVLRVGTITIISSDRSTPRLVLDGIPRSRPVFDSLKDRIIAVKRQRGVIKMDMGGGGGPS
jgi:membrane protein YdbS with pleckstrin-like domain